MGRPGESQINIWSLKTDTRNTKIQRTVSSNSKKRKKEKRIIQTLPLVKCSYYSRHRDSAILSSHSQDWKQEIKSQGGRKLNSNKGRGIMKKTLG